MSFDRPWVDVLALPVALLVSLFLGSTTVGSLLLLPFRIQFHELGHALVAWLSGRAALPLPFGFTFWREERSLFTGCCVVFLLGLLLVYAVREKRPFGVLVGALLSAAFVVLALVPASGCWVSGLSLWFGVWRGTRALPMGSILGTDGSGDLDRLMAEYGHDARSITAGYGELALWTVALVSLVYVGFGLRAWWRLRPSRSFVRRTARIASRVRP